MVRPRIWDRKELADKLLEWAELPSSLNINTFCWAMRDGLDPSDFLRMTKNDEQLSLAYRKAKCALAARREEANTEKLLGDAAYKCNLKVYDMFVDDKWKDEEKFKADLSRLDETNIPKDQENIDYRHENMILRAELASFKEKHVNQ